MKQRANAASISIPRTYGGSILHPGRADELVTQVAAQSHTHTDTIFTTSGVN